MRPWAAPPIAAPARWVALPTAGRTTKSCSVGNYGYATDGMRIRTPRFSRWAPGPSEILQRVPALSRTLSAIPGPRGPTQAQRQCAIAILYGTACHAIFAAAIASMVVGMWYGMSRAMGAVPMPWAWLVNLALLAQFPLGHSLLLSKVGRSVLPRLAPPGTGATLATTTYAIIASLQLLALFVLWSPTNVVWWRAEGHVLWAIGVLYAATWLLLMKAVWDAGVEVQSGLLGWLSLLRGVKPQYPPMPQTGVFRAVRQPIYVAFALTTWTVPTWTPDQLVLAVTFTFYCMVGPMFKERRFDRLFGGQWRDYRARTPYWIPFTRRGS